MYPNSFLTIGNYVSSMLFLWTIGAVSLVTLVIIHICIWSYSCIENYVSFIMLFVIIVDAVSLLGGNDVGSVIFLSYYHCWGPLKLHMLGKWNGCRFIQTRRVVFCILEMKHGWNGGKYFDWEEKNMYWPILLNHWSPIILNWLRSNFI